MNRPRHLCELLLHMQQKVVMPGSWSSMRVQSWRLRLPEPQGRVPIPCASSLWWGEATDEPAREDARPTNRFMAPMRVQSWRLKLSMNLKIDLLESMT